MPKVVIYKDEWYPVYTLSTDLDFYRDHGGSSDKLVAVPQEIISEYKKLVDAWYHLQYILSDLHEGDK